MSSRAHNTAGFSLIETLAVLVIISLVTGMVVIGMPRDKPAIETQGQDMIQSFNIAAQTSIISGKPQAFGLYEDAYLFYEFEGGEWVVVSETMWPEDLEVSFFKDELKLETPEEAVPLVVFEPMGLSTPFSLWLEGDEQTIIFTSEGDGKVMLENHL